MDSPVAQVITDHLMTTRLDVPRLLGVDGRSGSGKTHLAAAVADTLRQSSVSVTTVTMDDLYVGWEGLSASLPRLCEGIIDPLSTGRDGAYRRYDWEQGRLAEEVTVSATDVVIIEGVGATTHRCRSRFALTVWVQASPPRRLTQACARRGQGDFAAHAQAWSAQEDALFGSDTYPRAPAGYDFVVEGPRITTQIHD
ncbi:MAG: hypothetical protein WA962_01740 [Ornithinimicrobium sp.]